MRRTKEWWRQLTPEERSEVVRMERALGQGRRYSARLPDGYSGCAACEAPSHFSLCADCFERYDALLDKADKGIAS